MLHQGPRIFIYGPKGRLFMLFVNGIARLNPKTFDVTMIARPPVPIVAGGDYLDGRKYLASKSHHCSFDISRASK